MLIYIEMCQLCVIWAESLDSVTVSESVYVQLSIQCHLSAGTRHNPQIHSSPQSLIYSDHTFIILQLLSNEEVKLDVLISFKNL